MKLHESPVRRGGQGFALTGRGWFALAAATVLSALVIPAVVVVVEFGWEYVDGGLVFLGAASLVSLTWIVVLGLPAFFLLRYFGKERLVTLSMAGFVTGTLPIAVLAWPWVPGRGFPTLDRWLSSLGFVGVWGAMGAVSAAAFWCVWVYFSRASRPAISPDPRMK